MKNYLLDSNLILRIITGDNAILTNQAKNVFGEAAKGNFKLTITPMVIAECVYVLTSKNSYNLDRAKVVTAIQVIFNQKNVSVEEIGTILESLDLFSSTNLDFADCYLILKSRLAEFDGVKSFDKDLLKQL